jgi:SAM-dependent methyltransferase
MGPTIPTSYGASGVEGGERVMTVPELTAPVDVREIMQQIRSRIRDDAAARHPVTVRDLKAQGPPDAAPKSGGSHPSSRDSSSFKELPDWTSLEEAGRALKDTSSLIGQLPPEPPTFRGRLGAFFVRIVRRALFWYTPQIAAFQAEVTLYFKEFLAAMKTLADSGQQTSEELDAVTRRVAELGAETDRLAKTLDARHEEILTAARINSRGMIDSQVKGVLDGLEGMSRALGAEVKAREELARRLDAEAASRANLEQTLAAEIGTREALAREELARRLDAEAASRASLEQTLAAEIAAREAIARDAVAQAGAREELAHLLNSEAASRASLEQTLAAEIAAREALTRDTCAETRAREELARLLDASLRQRDISLTQLRAEVINQNRRISILIEEARKRLPAPLDQVQLSAIAGERNHALDALYVSFEDRFRGTRTDIKERFRVYLPYIEERKIGAERTPVLDLGCGRGEWLELLAEHKLAASGIDTNRVLLAGCRDAGLNVEEADLLEYLKNQPDHAFGAVTGFHIIEHVPFDILTRVFDETVRVLKPGGVAIFETPNPENVLVATHNFYVDFTHRNPLPSVTMQFILEAQGLCDVRILNLHPYPEALRLPDDGSEITMRFNQHFYGPQDYAVIGRKV